MVSLEELAHAVQEKGFPKPAILLQSRAGRNYLNALLQPRWRSRIEEAVGPELYGQLLQYWRSFHTEDDMILSRIFNDTEGPEISPIDSSFKPRNHDVPPLQITIDKIFNFADLQKAAELSHRAAELREMTQKIIYGDVSEQTKSNEELLFEIYKDSDDVSHLPPSRLKRNYFRLLQTRFERLERLMELNAPNMILTNEIQMILAFSSPFDCSPEKYHPQTWATEFEQKHVDLPEEELYAIGRKAVADAKEILTDNSKAESAFQQWVDFQRQTIKVRVLYIAKRDVEKLSAGRDNEYEQEFSPFTEANIVTEDDDDFDIELNGDALLQKLFKSPLSLRQQFLGDYEEFVKEYTSSLIGLQQIIQGGPVTNPHASSVSVLQNHGNFPNITYSQPTLEKLPELVSELQNIFNELPDILDLASPTKIRKAKQHVYEMSELPKDPFDVEFGNDAGCCIFVPEKIEQLQNGAYVPFYLLHPHVHLFAQYRKEEKKRQRMGLVLAFDTKTKDGKRILAYNSLELSRFGLSGGQSTISRLVEYDEQWLIGYAQKHGYQGALMGGHWYNTAFNFTSRQGEKVQEQVDFVQKMVQFYSDIFIADKERNVMTVRQNSCYWLWRK